MILNRHVKKQLSWYWFEPQLVLSSGNKKISRYDKDNFI